MLAFQITYLRGVVTAADVATGQRKDKVEWPPHPDRFFSALVQAWGDLGEPDEGRRALQWLEEAGPPWISAGRLLSANKVVRYVPVNDQPKGKTQIQGTGLCRDRQPRMIPQGAPEAPIAAFFWPDHVAPQQVREALSKLAAQVSHLGHSSSLVQVSLIESLPSGLASWKPDPDGELTFRVPFPGRLEELIAAYQRRWQAVSWPPLGLHLNYAEVREQSPVAKGGHGEMVLFRLRYDGAPLPLEACLRILTVWRRALMNAGPQPVPGILSGHAPESRPGQPIPLPGPHLALVPLPDVGHLYARGHLVGLAAVLPRNVSAADRKIALSTLSQVERLTVGELGVLRLEPVDGLETRKALQTATWTRPAQVWASVTPVLLGKFPRRLFSQESCEILMEACEIAGYPRPRRVDIAGVPWIAGSVPSLRFPAMPSRLGKPPRARLHARLEFEVPVRGPVLIGAGRHLGYGIFRQLEERR